MINRQLCGFLSGLSIGVSIALLFAPRSGRQMRTRIAEAAADGMAYAKETSGTVRDTARELVDKGRAEIARQKEGVNEAIKRGAQGYKEATARANEARS